MKLKPCPFCGREAKLTVYNTYIASFRRADKYYVCCSKNYHHSRQEDPLGFLSREQAIEAWNRRNEQWIKMTVGQKESQRNT